MTLIIAIDLVDACQLWRLERKKVREEKHKTKDSGSAPWEQASAAEQQEIWYLEMPRYSAAIRPGIMLAAVTSR